MSDRGSGGRRMADDGIVVRRGTTLAIQVARTNPDQGGSNAREDRGMPPETIESRVDHLERRVTDLETLPDRITAIESQIVQLRVEMRGEFSAVREEIRSGDEETRRVLGERIDETTRVLASGSRRPLVCSASGSTRTAATCACCTRTSSAASRLFRKGSRRAGAGERTAEVAGVLKRPALQRPRPASREPSLRPASVAEGQRSRVEPPATSVRRSGPTT